MKVCFINPVKFDFSQTPLGLAYLASYLQKYDDGKHEMKIIDENVGEIAEKELQKFKPDIVGITATTPQITRTMEIANFIKDNQDIPIIVGGVHPTVLPKRTLEEGRFDVCVISEGEITFFELVQLLKEGRFEPDNLKKIRGISFKDDGNVIITEKRPLIGDLDIIPFPARDLLNMNYYLKPVGVLRGVIKRATQIMSSRGCPYNCTFCSSFVVNRRRFRMHSPEHVIREIEHLIDKYKIEALFFQDDNFVVNKERAKKICQLII